MQSSPTGRRSGHDRTDRRMMIAGSDPAKCRSTRSAARPTQRHALNILLRVSRVQTGACPLRTNGCLKLGAAAAAVCGAGGTDLHVDVAESVTVPSTVVVTRWHAA